MELNHVRMYKENENERDILRKNTLSGIIGNNYRVTENDKVKIKAKISSEALKNDHPVRSSNANKFLFKN
ncbi:hypothetical protein NQ317_001826 [Molorchus minor]|uniref:Uncharacterized protein n=1 Tax=Molorchus minor TaxID=1323400 RepID=A0ABQ9JB79_9CUCU|nr:hypothetical protein NQ317_001826 [Molorchus minor]